MKLKSNIFYSNTSIHIYYLRVFCKLQINITKEKQNFTIEKSQSRRFEEKNFTCFSCSPRTGAGKIGLQQEQGVARAKPRDFARWERLRFNP